jgi:hypothetical protein
VRVNFNYFISEEAFEFILEAVHFVAREGAKLLPHYRFEPDTGLWRHRAGRPAPVMRLTELCYRRGHLSYRARHATEPETVLASYLEEARAIVDAATEGAGAIADPPLNADFEALRWFPLPGEVAAEAR